MTTNPPIRPLSHLNPLLLCLCLIVAGCGGSNYSPPSQPPPSPTPGADVISMQGSWTIWFQSSVTSNTFTVLEANISQSGTSVFAGAPSALVYQGTTLETTIPLTSLGSRCDSGAVGQVTFDGAISNVHATSETLTFTLTENGNLGTAVISGSATTNGMQVLNGTYTLPPACGSPGDHGTFQGFQDSVRFSGTDPYYGNFPGNAFIVRFLSGDGFNISVSGTDNGTPFTLTGSTTGFFLTLTGQISSQEVTWFGLYDSLYNTFQLYDSDGKPVGTLTPNPWDY